MTFRPGARAARFLLALMALPVMAGGTAHAADFYAGKKIDFIIGGDAGGGYDIYARLIAKHLQRFIPGAPLVVVRNMPGAGSGTAAANIFRLAPKDGTTIGALFPGVIVDPLLQEHGPNLFDATKFLYLGSANSDARLCITGPTSKIKTHAQAMEQKTIIGATQTGGSTRDYAYFHQKATGVKFDIVSGYKGSTEILLATERGEVDGICGIDWSSLKSQKPDWLRDKTVNLLVQDGVDVDPELQALGVPTIWDFVKSDRDREAIKLIVGQQVFARPYVAPPGIPAEQAKILRDAFSAVMADPAFKADAETAHLAITPSSGEKVQEVVDKLYAEPKDVVQRARELIAP